MAKETLRDLMAALEQSLQPFRRCQWPECCGDPDEDDFCGGCSREAWAQNAAAELTHNDSFVNE